MSNSITAQFLHELNSEYDATKKCLERITEDKFEFKPHETSMNMKYLAMLVAEIPLWLRYMVTDGEIDFATFPHKEPTTNAELLQHFEENMEAARKALQEMKDESLNDLFSLKRKGELLYSAPKRADIPTTLNHWVHHRGQLTVYMRMTGLAVPAIYGPSGDDKNFKAPE